MDKNQRRTLEMLRPNFAADSAVIVPRGSLPEQLLAEIESSTDGKFLVAGQRGMGKTTELRRLFDLLKQGPFVPLFIQFGAQETITYPMIIDALAQALFNEPHIKLKPQLKKLYQNWYTEEEELISAVEIREGSASIGGQLYIVGAKKGVSHKKSTAKTKKTRVFKGLQDLLDVFNEIIFEAQKSISKKVVFIVDDVDKIQDISSIERTFIHTPHVIYSIEAPSIFTVPITYATTSLTRIGGLSYGGIYRVPAIEIVSQNGEPNTTEINFMKEVLRLRMPYNPLTDDMLKKIIEYSGGVLIDAMRLARGVCKKKILNDNYQPDLGTVEEEFQDLVDDYKFTFENSQLWKELARICGTDNKNVILTSGMLPDLLYKVIVIEYRGQDTWFDVHPAARRLFEQNREVIQNIERPAT